MLDSWLLCKNLLMEQTAIYTSSKNPIQGISCIPPCPEAEIIWPILTTRGVCPQHNGLRFREAISDFIDSTVFPLNSTSGAVHLPGC